MAHLICGVDVSSRTLEAAIGRTGTPSTFPNTTEGIASLAAFCHQHQVTLVAMEATGGYERQACALLDASGLAVAVLNPRSVRQFAQSVGRLEKTDQIDAGIIAWFAEVTQPTPMLLPSSAQLELRGQVTRLRQLTQLHTSQLNQQRLVHDPGLRASFQQLLTLIKQQIEQLATQIAAHIEADPLWRELNQVFRSIKGVADRTIARLMADLPEIGTLSHKRISKLAGLAPLANDSGKHQGKRAIRGGRSSIREILYIVASVVVRFEPDFTAFRERLREKGKPAKLIRIAVAHKLLIRLNAKAKEARLSLKTQTASLKLTTAAGAVEERENTHLRFPALP